MRNVWIKVEGKQIASLPEAVANLSINRIEVIIDEVFLSNETIGLLKLGFDQKPKEFDIGGRVNDRILIVEKAIVDRLTFDATRGEAVLLRNILIRGLQARWDFEN